VDACNQGHDLMVSLGRVTTLAKIFFARNLMIYGDLSILPISLASELRRRGG
jgi:hypothetical protein